VVRVPDDLKDAWVMYSEKYDFRIKSLTRVFTLYLKVLIGDIHRQCPNLSNKFKGVATMIDNSVWE